MPARRNAASSPPADAPDPTEAQVSDGAAGFAELGLPASLTAVLAELGYEEPTAVQRETIPAMLAGGDLLVQAATGTGKTAAFALPILKRLSDEAAPGSGPRAHPTRALVLVPTRELAIQVAEALHRYARGSGLNVVPVYGGAPMPLQIRALARGADIVVATPGRALDHLGRKRLVLDGLLVLVLDEADEMLDMGFAEELDQILEATPASRQTTLFSATMPPRIETIAKRHLRDARRVTVAGEKPAAGKLPRVRQLAYVVRREQKADALGRVLDVESPESALVFCRTRIEVDTLVESLGARGYRAEALHGGMQQRQRDAVMNRFRAAKTDLLIATDVAARGLDIKQLSHVVNFDLPASSDAYVHRIGRTGRAGREGTAITFVEPREHRHLRFIEQRTRQRIEVVAVPSVADLRARRLARTQQAVRERLVAGELDAVRSVVESLAGEFDLFDVAAAAVQVAHAATAGDGDEDEREIEPAPEPPERESWSRGGSAKGRGVGPRGAGPRTDGSGAGGSRGDGPPPHGGPATGPRKGAARRTAAAGRLVRLQVGAGREAGIRPGDLVGAIVNESGVPPGELGAIEIEARSSFIDVPEARADDIIAALEGTKLRGKKVRVRRKPEG